VNLARQPGYLRIALLAAAFVAVCSLFSWPGVTARAVDAGPAAQSSPAQAADGQVAEPSPSASATPTWRLKSYQSVGGDKSFKADLIDELPSPPELVVFGGSRAMRFEPSVVRDLTGLTAFNAAVQCFRPEDAWAYSSYLVAQSPETALHCVIALQVRSFRADHLRAGLLYDTRLSSAFPPELVAKQQALLPSPPLKQVLGQDRYSARGCLLRNRYDVARERPGFSYRHQIDVSIRRLLDAHRWTGAMTAPRPHSYFEATMHLYNDRGVTPLIILMPVQPRALKAFREVGFQRSVDDLRAYLRDAQSRCSFHVLNLTDISTFGGKPGLFYDAVHPMRANARLILKFAVAAAPECFR
jgi:hypothetical protein